MTRPRSPLPALRRAPLRALLATLLVVGGLLPGSTAVYAEAPDAGGSTTSADPRPASGRWPLEPRPAVVSPFDPPAANWGRGHRGVDLEGHVGQSVRSALPGRVRFVGRVAGVAVVVVDHTGTRTTYQPVSGTVSVGQRVAAGAVIGRLSWHGTHCAPRACLHWGWRRGQAYLDPLDLIGPRPVRLLPLDEASSMWDRAWDWAWGSRRPGRGLPER